MRKILRGNVPNYFLFSILENLIAGWKLKHEVRSIVHDKTFMYFPISGQDLAWKHRRLRPLKASNFSAEWPVGYQFERALPLGLKPTWILLGRCRAEQAAEKGR